MFPAQPNRSLVHGLACLQLVAGAEGALGTREIARRLGLEPTRVSRLLGTLAHLGLAERTPGRKFRPGPAIHVLAAQSLRGSRLLRCALPVLRELRDARCIVALGVLWGDEVCYLVHAPPGREVESGIGGHGLYPADQSGIGRVLLAYRAEGQPPARRRRLALARIRRQGYAALRAVGGYTLGVPVGPRAEAGLGLSGRMDGRSIPRWVRRLQDAARRIQEARDGAQNGERKR